MFLFSWRSVVLCLVLLVFYGLILMLPPGSPIRYWTYKYSPLVGFALMLVVLYGLARKR